MKYTGITVIIYGILIFIGGLMGYIKAQSVPSLIMGVSFAAMIIGSGIALSKGRFLGVYVAGGASFTLACFFLFRFLKTFQFLPAGGLSILSVCIFSALVIEWMKARLKKIRP